MMSVEHLHLLGDLGHDGPEIGARTRALKGRLGHFARPEGRNEPFRARALAEPALQRTDKTNLRHAGASAHG